MKTTRLVVSFRARTGRSPLPSLLLLTAAGLILGPLAYSVVQGSDDPLEGLPPANEGAFEGGATGTYVDAAEETPIPEGQLSSNKIPTEGKPSPLFGATSFSQKLVLFEELGTTPLPRSFTPGRSLPLPTSVDRGPDPAALDSFLAEAIYPEPTRLANDRDMNPWQPVIEAFLGRPLDTPPAEGRPAGEGWAHQRWNEFPPEVYFKTAITGARRNSGLRDSRQLHGYAVGEFGPGGLYHNTAGLPGTSGTTRGLDIRLHPAMPIQGPNSVWTFDGTLPPKLLMGRYGEPILMRNYNALPIDPSANRGFGLHTLSTHHHNGHNPAESDGFANAFFFPGQYYDYRWPMILAGHDWENRDALDYKAGAPDGRGGIRRVRGDFREVASTHWFHDHMLDFTAQNVYKGNAAMFNLYSAVDRGNEGLDDGINLRFPSGTGLDWGNRDYDVNLVIADKAWLPDGQLWFNIFNLDGFLGDRLTVNWQYHPYLEVRARKYRFRILNGSVARYLKLALVDQAGRTVPFHMIANDGNIMEHAVAFDGTLGTQHGVLPTQAIAERYDIVVDFSRFRPGDRLYFVNLLEHADGKGPKDPIPLNEILSGEYRAVEEDGDGDGLADEWKDGDPCVGKFMEFRVMPYAGQDLSMNPAEFVSGKKVMIPLPEASPEEIASAVHRTFEFGRSGGTDEAPWSIKTDGGSGLGADPRRVSAAVEIGSTTTSGGLEIWHIKNGGNGWSHPVHVHFEEGIILTKDGNPPPEWEKWARKDMYRVGPEVDSSSEIEVRIRVRDFAGTYVEHCHNTQHEDHAMLLRWDALAPGQIALMPAPIPTWDGVEFVDSVALPTAFTGDGVGPVFPIPGDGGYEPPVETLALTSATWSAANGWRIQGTNVNAPVGTSVRVRARLGSTLAGTIIGSATLQPDTRFDIRVSGGPQPGSSARISLESSTGASLLDLPVTIEATGGGEVLTVTSASYSSTSGWRITGTDTGAPAGTSVRVRVRVGSTLTGTLLGTATVQAGGAFTLTAASTIVPDASRTISLDTNTGARLLAVPVTVEDGGGEVLTVTGATWSATTGWRITGTDTGAPAGTTVRIRARVGSTLSGTIIGSAQVATDGRFTVRVSGGPQPDASNTVSLESTAGATRLAVPLQRVP